MSSSSSGSAIRFDEKPSVKFQKGAHAFSKTGDAYKGLIVPPMTETNSEVPASSMMEQTGGTALSLINPPMFEQMYINISDINQ